MFRDYQNYIDSIKEDEELTFDEKTHVIWIYTFTLAGVTLLNWLFVKPLQIIGWCFCNFDKFVMLVVLAYALWLVGVAIFVGVQ